MINKTIFTFEKLYLAYLDCRKTKRKTINALKFEWDLERNLFQLQKQLENREYRPGRSICFAIKEPSPREIFAAAFRDRVVHHLLIREILEMGERNFIFDSFACRKNKGTYAAIKRLRNLIRQVARNGRENAFYCQLDISGFFMSIDHDILFSIFQKFISKQNKPEQWKEEVLWLARTVIFCKPTKNYLLKGNLSLFKLIPPRKSLFYSGEKCGLPIGNYSSQFFANLYLNELDQFIKRKLRRRYYIRYVDDFILLDRDKEKLKLWRDEINNFLRDNLKLKLSSQKTKIQPIKAGIDFLGYFVKPDYILVRKKVVSRLKNKMHSLNEAEKEISDLKRILATINSYYGHFQHAFSFNLRKHIYESHLGKMKERFSPKTDYSYLKIK